MAKEKTTGLLSDLIPVPGETIEELLKKNHISQADLALRTGSSTKHINQLVKGKKRITIDMANKLSCVFDGLGASFWNNLQCIYDDMVQKVNDRDNMTAEEKHIAASLPYNDLLAFGYFDKKDPSIEEKVEIWRSFLHVSNLTYVPASYRLDSVCYPSAFKKTDDSSFDCYIMSIWIQMCLLSDKSNSYPFSKNMLRKSFSLIRREIHNSNIEKAIQNIKGILLKCGVVFNVIHYLEGAPVQGYIRKLDDHVLMCLTLRKNYQDAFWFALAHEIGHLLYSRSLNEGLLDFKCGEFLVLGSEKQATDFEENFLIPSKDFNGFICNPINERTIRDFANKESVDPGIVVGRLIAYNFKYQSEFSYLRKEITFDKLKFD